MDLDEDFLALRVGDSQGEASLASLPLDVLAKVLENCSISDVAHLCLASRAMHRALLFDDRGWLALVRATWGHSIDYAKWLTAASLAPPPCNRPPPNQFTHLPPTTYRQLYMLLHSVAPIVGLWRLIGEGPRSSLISFSWGADCIEAHEIVPSTPLTGRARWTPWTSIRPAGGLTTSVFVDGEEAQHATVTVCHTAQGARMRRSPSAEAAAAASSGLPRSQVLNMLDCLAVHLSCWPHPKSLFCCCRPARPRWDLRWNGWTSWRGASRRRAATPSSGVARSVSQAKDVSAPQTCCAPSTVSELPPVPPTLHAWYHAAARPEGPTVYHLKRLPQLPVPSAKHPHSGLWVADYGPQGLELLQLEYDFRGRAAQLRGVKVTGDEFIPAGQCSWHCAAAALPIPWGADDQQLVEQQEERWLAEREWWTEDDSDGSSDGSSADLTPRLQGPGPLAAGIPRVIAIHKGSGQVARPGFELPEWVEGKLLVSSDGRLSFCWLENLEHVTDMRRLRMRR